MVMLLTAFSAFISSGLSAQAVVEAGGLRMNAIALHLEAMRGHKLAASVSVKGSDLSPKPQSWDGIKAMLKVESPGETTWPHVSMPEGSFDWRSFRGIIGVPESATALTLILGLERVSGKFEMRDLRISLRPQVPLSSQPARRRRQSRRIP